MLVVPVSVTSLAVVTCAPEEGVYWRALAADIVAAVLPAEPYRPGTPAGTRAASMADRIVGGWIDRDVLLPTGGAAGPATLALIPDSQWHAGCATAVGVLRRIAKLAGDGDGAQGSRTWREAIAEADPGQAAGPGHYAVVGRTVWDPVERGLLCLNCLEWTGLSAGDLDLPAGTVACVCCYMPLRP